VLIVEVHRPKLFGLSLSKVPRVSLEHADPSPDGDVFDAVDDNCHRPRVTRDR
jgi:hypothetical protein